MPYARRILFSNTIPRRGFIVARILFLKYRYQEHAWFLPCTAARPSNERQKFELFRIFSNQVSGQNKYFRTRITKICPDFLSSLFDQNFMVETTITSRILV